MIKIKNRNKKKNFSNAVLLSCLAEDLAYENKCLMEIISDYNQIVEVEITEVRSFSLNGKAL